MHGAICGAISQFSNSNRSSPLWLPTCAALRRSPDKIANPNPALFPGGIDLIQLRSNSTVAGGTPPRQPWCHAPAQRGHPVASRVGGNVAVEDFLVVVVLGLDHLVADTKLPAKL